MFYNTLDPILFSLGPLSIRWYGVMYALAFLFTYWYAKRRIDKTTFTLKDLDDVILYLVVAMILGARIFEVVFWQPTYYFSNPWKIIAIWEGGLSFHGALAAMVLVAYIFCKKVKKSLPELADLMIVPLSLGQAFGRIGNWFNSELFGKITSLPWGVNFHGELDALGDVVFRHPNMLYEAGYNTIIFGILWLLKDKGYKPGTLFYLWLVMYAVCRFLTEFLRINEPLVVGFTVGQLFNLVMIFIGSVGLYYIKSKNSSHDA
ncbi:prolipoprotein diacylglyceryl transferase [archaeon]|jgi:phosphatidylglycerol---prolipoprotein diacylglyceryl transferase|nr:prolipoprotein diacylglyceryl transferase [archaeon]